MHTCFRVLPLFCLLLFAFPSSAQEKPAIEYYLPAANYNPAIPTPAAYLGYEVGEWHTSHDQLLGYMRALDAASERITLAEYGRSHENRPLICLTITSPDNHARLDDIRNERAQLTQAPDNSRLNVQNMPAVNYMGYSIHGNETSGSHAALLVAYYLAAAQTREVEQLLRNTVILFDPCFNPDGMQRFSSWINSHKSIHPSPDPSGDEYNEPWPRGRTNHYGFDLNRDWLVAQQPESVGRVAIFQSWRPNVLTDHHEMGSNSTFFFQPGVPSRVNPITPPQNQALTAKIAGFHAKLLSEKKILFYTGENFDDFYYGKGSTYPDAQGSIGILFEQASSRGSVQDTENGLLTFPYSIRNQVFASLSTLQAVGEMRVELNEYLRDFYRTALDEARKSEIKGYVFADGDVPAREFLFLLGRHRIEVQNLAADLNLNGTTFKKGNAFFVQTEQAQYRLIRGIFERQTAFTDSIFYDISAWTLPDAFGLEWSPVKAKDYDLKKQSPGLGLVSLNPPARLAGGPEFAYVIPAEGYEIPRVLAHLQRSGLRVRVAMEPFEAEGVKYSAGALLVAADRQPVSAADFVRIMDDLAGLGVRISIIENGLTAGGPDLGSSNFPVVRSPKILMLTGEGVTVADAGEIWHLFDTRYNIPMTLVETERFASLNLSKYNTLILADGTYSRLPAEKVKQFVQEGGTLIATGGALKWLKNAGIAAIEFRNQPADPPGRRPYGNLSEDRGARTMPGAIFEAELDLTHPLNFGYNRQRLPVFLSDTLFVEPAKNPYASPVVLTSAPLLAGYIHPMQKPLTAHAAAVAVYGHGRGKVICFAGNPNFRGFWYGTNRMFANAVFYGNLISGEAAERK
ncbi:MAG: M14 family metallopeptidase [Saprospiraceae bacterium]|nr:M14 family metallopeptidase [Saprospiraceae bacterium]